MHRLLRLAIAGAGLSLLLPLAAVAQPTTAYTSTDDLRDVRPFFGWFADAVITGGIDLEPEARFGNGDNFTSGFFGARAAVQLRPKIEVGGRIGLGHFSPEGFDGETGLSDLFVYGRYLLLDEGLKVSFGGGLDLPIGEENIGASTTDFEAFLAARLPLVGGATLTGHVAIESFEFIDRENGLRIVGGGIFPTTEELSLIAEVQLSTATDALNLAAGIDYEMPPGGHLRAGIQLGLDNDAEDVALFGSIAIPVW